MGPPSGSVLYLAPLPCGRRQGSGQSFVILAPPPGTYAPRSDNASESGSLKADLLAKASPRSRAVFFSSAPRLGLEQEQH